MASEWETVIGLECHVQLATKSKLFSPAPSRYGDAPNANVDVVDAGLPGVLPVVNDEAVRKLLKLTTRISTKNMYAFSCTGAISQYTDPRQIVAEFVGVRRALYVRRKQLEEALMTSRVLRLANQCRFLEMLAEVCVRNSVGVRHLSSCLPLRLACDGERETCCRNSVFCGGAGSSSDPLYELSVLWFPLSG